MKNISFFIIIICFLCTACEKQEYESYKIEAPLNIVRLSLSPNSPVLIADGTAELKFIVKAFCAVENTRLIQKEVDGEINLIEKTYRDTIEVSAEQLDSSQIKIYQKDGTPVDWTFKTTDLSEDTLVFLASYQGFESTPRKVALRPVPTDVFEPITVPVIFHIVVPRSQANAYASIHAEDIEKLIDRVNRVFKNEIIHAPSSIDSKITFELATHDPKGNELKEKGINRVEVSDETSINSYIKSYLIWDINHYLNIYISEFTEDQVNLPAYILNNGSHLEMGDRYIRTVNNISDAKYYSFNEVAIGITRSTYYSMVQDNKGLEDALGIFYGLFPTYYGIGVGELDDFCDDTYTAAYSNMSLENWTYQEDGNHLYKNGNEIYYNSYQIMDVYGPAYTITYDQVKRIRTVIENCPFRMMRK